MKLNTFLPEVLQDTNDTAASATAHSTPHHKQELQHSITISINTTVATWSPQCHHNNWHILAVLAMAAMDSWTIAKGRSRKAAGCRLVVLSTLSCREGTRVALLQALLLLVPGALQALEALNYWRPFTNYWQTGRSSVFFDVSTRLLDLFWDIKTGTTLCLASEFYSYPPAQSMSTTHCLARRCSSRSR